MQQRYRFVGPFMLALWGSALSVAQAQPDPNQVPKGANPAPPEPPAPVFINPGGDLPGWIKPGGPMPMGNGLIVMQTLPQMQTQMLRQQLQAAGFTEQVLQDAVAEFMQAQDKARGPLREKAREVDAATRSPATTDAQMLTLTNALRIAIEDEKVRSEAALKALDAKIGYAKKPRLEAFLLMRGLLGDETAYLTSPASALNGGGLGLPDLAQQIQVWPLMDGGQLAPNNWDFFGIPNGAQDWMAPGNGPRTYITPPQLHYGAPLTVPGGLAANQIYKYYNGAANGQAGQPTGNTFLVAPPVVPQGDVIAPPAVAPNGFVQAPPLQPVPLSQRN